MKLNLSNPKRQALILSTICGETHGDAGKPRGFFARGWRMVVLNGWPIILFILLNLLLVFFI